MHADLDQKDNSPGESFLLAQPQSLLEVYVKHIISRRMAYVLEHPECMNIVNLES